MKRSEFLKILGIGAAAAVVAPSLAIELFKDAKEDVLGFKTTKIAGYTFHTKSWPLMDNTSGHIWWMKDEMEQRAKFERYAERQLFFGDVDKSLSEFHSKGISEGFNTKSW